MTAYVAFPPVTDGATTPTPDIFGPLIGAREVRDAVRDTIATWSPTYLAALQYRTGVTLPLFGTWVSIYDTRALPSGQTPACWVTCKGTDPKQMPHRDGDGKVRARWLVDVNIVVYGTTWDEAADLVNLYSTAVRAVILQHRSLGGFATDTVWQGDGYTEAEHQAKRSVGVGVNRFAVSVSDVTDTSTGPNTPNSPIPAGGWPTVDETNTAAENYRAVGPLGTAIPPGFPPPDPD